MSSNSKAHSYFVHSVDPQGLWSGSEEILLEKNLPFRASLFTYNAPDHLSDLEDDFLEEF